MTTRLTTRFAALLLLGSVAGVTAAWAQLPASPGPPEAPPLSTTQPAAPIERQPPLAPAAPGAPRPMLPHTFMRGPLLIRDRGIPMDGHGDMRGAMWSGFHIVPPGIWWRDQAVVQRLSLTAEQTKKMDGMFQQSRLQLIDLRANVERQNAILDPMLSANPIDQAKALAQIDKVAQARAELEKADAKMLLGIRAVLTPEQWTKLQNRGDRGFPGMPGRFGTMSGPEGQAAGARSMRGGGGPSGPAEPVAPKPEP